MLSECAHSKEDVLSWTCYIPCVATRYNFDSVSWIAKTLITYLLLWFILQATM